ncbi:MAG: hypothetical protein J6O55_02140 [Lachnospiraceae bacterium]|nr:hypothetical protein [Lachnospiraceae bacterium]
MKTDSQDQIARYDGENKNIRITDIYDESREFKQDDLVRLNKIKMHIVLGILTTSSPSISINVISIRNLKRDCCNKCLYRADI